MGCKDRERFESKNSWCQSKSQALKLQSSWDDG